MSTPTPAEAARIAAGYTLEAAAKKLNRCPRYLRRLEKRGGATLSLARKAARIYNCDGNVFIFPPEYFAPRPVVTGEAEAAKPERPGVLRRI